MELENLRRSYEEHALDHADLHADPLIQFQNWFATANTTPSAEWFEPNAMTLATSDAHGKVAARIVLLKRLTAEGFAFFTNYQSSKAEQLAQNPQACLLFYWPHVERQVRIEGSVIQSDAATSDEYFHARPRGSQIGAIVSEQSRPLQTRQELEDLAAKLTAQYEGLEIPRPDYWGGYILKPSRYEFWQGRPNRLHDRFTYEQKSSGTTWTITRLAP